MATAPNAIPKANMDRMSETLPAISGPILKAIRAAVGIKRDPVIDRPAFTNPGRTFCACIHVSSDPTILDAIAIFANSVLMDPIQSTNSIHSHGILLYRQLLN